MTALINKRSLTDEVAYRLQEQITSGQYQLNEKLPIEQELMKQFGVGRSTIREAIKTLSNSGFLRVQQGLGTFVESTTPIKEPMDQLLKRADVRDLDEIRQLLEMKIAEKAAINRTDEDILQIETHLNERKRTALAGQLAECVDADILFHTAIAHASKNVILADLYKSVSIHLKKFFMEIYGDTTPFIDSQTLHAQLLKSIIAKDQKKAWSTAAKIIGHVLS